MTDVVVFDLLIPLTDHFTGAVDPASKFNDWIRLSVERFGGLTTLGLALEGFWYDVEFLTGANPVRDRSNWYKIGVPPTRIAELRAYVEITAREFGQKCIYLERTGEAEFVWDPAHRPPPDNG